MNTKFKFIGMCILYLKIIHIYADEEQPGITDVPTPNSKVNLKSLKQVGSSITTNNSPTNLTSAMSSTPNSNTLPGNLSSELSSSQVSYPEIPDRMSNISSMSNMSNLKNIDSNANDLLQLRRKIEIEKSAAELKKIRYGDSGGHDNTGTSINLDKAQTTVTGVAINENGRKIAWLQFADGGSLIVNLGSQVGRYVVTDINMTGVELTNMSRSNLAKSKRLFLRRVYEALEKPKNQQGVNPLFSPSPITTNANHDMVPPIVPVH